MFHGFAGPGMERSQCRLRTVTNSLTASTSAKRVLCTPSRTDTMRLGRRRNWQRFNEHSKHYDFKFASPRNHLLHTGRVSFIPGSGAARLLWCAGELWCAWRPCDDVAFSVHETLTAHLQHFVRPSSLGGSRFQFPPVVGDAALFLQRKPHNMEPLASGDSTVR